MSNDLSQRLRNEKANGHVYSVNEKRKLNALLDEAADEIERMVDEITAYVEKEAEKRPTPNAADSAHCLCQPPALNRETGICIQCGKRPAPNR